MKNLIIMDVARIENKIFKNIRLRTLEDFDSEHVHGDILPHKAIEMCDAFIVTDQSGFKILKCRVPNMPERIVLPLSYLAHTINLLQEWQRR